MGAQMRASAKREDSDDDDGEIGRWLVARKPPPASRIENLQSGAKLIDSKNEIHSRAERRGGRER